MARETRGQVDVTPSARRLTNSLRDIGYDTVAALADIVDNSIAANASKVEIEIVFDGPLSYVLVADDGHGMTERELIEALRFGTRREYESGDLGRYGLGLKTASISQCRRVSVATRRSAAQRRLAVKTLDLDHIEATDRWEVIDPPNTSRICRSLEWLNDVPGTVICWERLDRVLPEKRPEGGWAKRRLDQLADRTREYLGMVFHRFLEGSVSTNKRLSIAVNGEKARPWDPFATFEEHRLEMPVLSFEVNVGDMGGRVELHRYVLPPRRLFSSSTEFDRLSGPLKWNRQQGLYLYRADRLIQHGGWCGIRAADEHTKFARAAVDFPTELDALFQINVAKMRASLPLEVRTLLERPVHDLCRRAEMVYRREGSAEAKARQDVASPRLPKTGSREIGTALITAALDADEHDAFIRVMDKLRVLSPDVAAALGW